jgi:hypothetical protein
MSNKYYLARFLSEEYDIPLGFCSNTYNFNVEYNTVSVDVREKAIEIDKFIKNKLSSRNYFKEKYYTNDYTMSDEKERKYRRDTGYPILTDIINSEEYESRLDELYQKCLDLEEIINKSDSLDENYKVAFKTMSAFIKTACTKNDRNIIANFNLYSFSMSNLDNKLTKYSTIQSKISSKVNNKFDNKDEAIEYAVDEYAGSTREFVNFIEKLDS